MVEFTSMMKMEKTAEQKMLKEKEIIMEQMKSFSPEVCKQIKYYVYRLIDPRNGQTFYVGKGKDNRVFAHVNDALKNYEGKSYIDKDSAEDDTSAKIQTIRDIKNEGLDVIHVIHRYGMTNDEAFEVESALMDAYPGLTNIQGGHNNDRGITNVISLQQKYSLEIYEEKSNFKYILIKVKESRVKELQNEKSLNWEDSVYETVRASWKINPNNANKYSYVLGSVDGIVRGVYKVRENGWKLASNGVRYEFDKDDNPDDNIVKHFINKRIPDKYTKRGAANPVQYHG